VVIDSAVEPPPPGGERTGGGEVTTESFGKYSYLYVVLEAPKTPMTPAWVSVLDYSCYWAAGKFTALQANTALTDTLWARGTFNGGFHHSGSTRDWTPYGETFHLKSFLARADCPFGECNDFADFLLCMSASVGASELRSQRSSATMAEELFLTYHLTPARRSGGTYPWTYHQFGLLGSAVWDGCISITGYGVPKGWERTGTYKPRLVNYYVTGTWNPTPASGFTPLLTTVACPPWPPQ
jgi:hypothetical protein